ncbi:methyl-accepting chemotaxis protein [Aneurinibacillus soli]|uniref:Methyl-accepting chemotaxis protein McpB n=1 Tax=Aneurinibacillus soli TaxID=1500254 RepID=A0A0U5B171_9BACL|nr:HAMP domain-containing methyl-accepting chemotaxis protein [Aneurinibacillus soli]PYE62476.1 methyl-accepting chemotaxis protein [Aneurinibacillus soli]BAU27039.1 Methyl-accepting chemotaxis protein McpB [Aneurinibacillus soli]
MLGTLRFKIIVPITILTALVIICISTLVYNQTASTLESQGRATAELTRISFENALTARKTAEDIMNKEMIGQATMTSLLMKKGTNFNEITDLAKRAGIDEFWITDATGKTVLTNVGPAVHLDFSAEPGSQAYAFMDLISGKQKEMSQAAQVRNFDGQVFKYVGVPGWNEPRIVQVGRKGQMLTELDNQIGASPLLARIKSQLSDQIVLAALINKDGKVVAASEKSFSQIPPALSTLMNQASSTTTIKEKSDYYQNKKVTYYAASLSNGQKMVVAISNEVLTRIFTLSIASVLIGIVLVIAFLIWLVSRTLRPLHVMEQSLLMLADGKGDLTKRLPDNTNDEIGRTARAFNQMLDHIQQLIRQIQQSSVQVAASSEQLTASAEQTRSASEQIASIVQELAAQSEQQTKDMETGAHDVQNISKGMEGISQTTGSILDTIGVTVTKATEGNNAIHQAVTQMNSINETMATLAKGVQTLADRSNQINEIIEVITGISAQTNLLALNAAIEAARAGEHGRGFAIVSDEVRKLAEQSAHSAQKIAELVSGIQQETAQTVQFMTTAISEVQEGITVIHTAGLSFTEIEQAIRQVEQQTAKATHAVQTIQDRSRHAVASIQTAHDLIEQAASRTEQISAATEEQLATFEETSASAASLSRMAGDLEASVKKFVV